MTAQAEGSAPLSPIKQGFREKCKTMTKLLFASENSYLKTLKAWAYCLNVSEFINKYLGKGSALIFHMANISRWNSHQQKFSGLQYFVRLD